MLIMLLFASLLPGLAELLVVKEMKCWAQHLKYLLEVNKNELGKWYRPQLLL